MKNKNYICHTPYLWNSISIMIFGTLVQNDDFSFFSWFFWVVRGVKVQKMAQNNKKSCSYLRNCTLYDLCHLWYTCVKWYLQEFFQIFKILVFCVVTGLPKKSPKWQKFYLLFNWDSLHARLNSHHKTCSFKKKKHKNMLWQSCIIGLSCIVPICKIKIFLGLFHFLHC